MDTTLIVWRAIHFLATIEVAGLVIFCAFVIRPAQASVDLCRRLSGLFWLSFVILLISGAAWWLAVARAIDGAAISDAVRDGTALTVLTDTQFGNAWIVRIVAALVLALIFSLGGGRLRIGVQVGAAIVLVAGLAYAGHGASSSGVDGDVHLIADILHLIAVSCWVGGLLPYAMVLYSLQNPAETRRVTERYSNFATLAVATILATGIVNTYFLVATPTALVTTVYGRLLAFKVFVFAAMLVLAAVNRFVLMARLSPADISALNRNALIEFGLGCVALALVAAFGAMPPPLFGSE